MTSMPLEKIWHVLPVPLLLFVQDLRQEIFREDLLDVHHVYPSLQALVMGQGLSVGYALPEVEI